MPTRKKFRRNNRNKKKSRRKRQRGGADPPVDPKRFEDTQYFVALKKKMKACPTTGNMNPWKDLKTACDNAKTYTEWLEAMKKNTNKTRGNAAWQGRLTKFTNFYDNNKNAWYAKEIKNLGGEEFLTSYKFINHIIKINLEEIKNKLTAETDNKKKTENVEKIKNHFANIIKYFTEVEGDGTEFEKKMKEELMVDDKLEWKILKDSFDTRLLLLLQDDDNANDLNIPFPYDKMIGANFNDYNDWKGWFTSPDGLFQKILAEMKKDKKTLKIDKILKQGTDEYKKLINPNTGKIFGGEFNKGVNVNFVKDIWLPAWCKYIGFADSKTDGETIEFIENKAIKGTFHLNDVLKLDGKADPFKRKELHKNALQSFYTQYHRMNSNIKISSTTSNAAEAKSAAKYGMLKIFEYLFLPNIIMSAKHINENKIEQEKWRSDNNLSLIDLDSFVKEIDLNLHGVIGETQEDKLGHSTINELIKTITDHFKNHGNKYKDLDLTLDTVKDKISIGEQLIKKKDNIRGAYKPTIDTEILHMYEKKILMFLRKIIQTPGGNWEWCNLHTYNTPRWREIKVMSYVNKDKKPCPKQSGGGRKTRRRRRKRKRKKTRRRRRRRR